MLIVDALEHVIYIGFFSVIYHNCFGKHKMLLCVVVAVILGLLENERSEVLKVMKTQLQQKVVILQYTIFTISGNVCENVNLVLLTGEGVVSCG